MKHDYIKKVFTDLETLKEKGIWFGGIKKDGEYKSWHTNGRLQIHCFYENGKKDGEYKFWNNNGKLLYHCFYKDDKVVKDYLKESELI